MTVRSLRTRMLLATSVVVIAMAAAVGLFSSITAKRQFDRVMLLERRAPAESRAAAEAIERAYRTTHSWDAVSAAKRRAIVIDAAGRPVARYPRELDAYAVRGVPGGLELTRRHAGRAETIAVRGGWRLTEWDGRVVATVYFVPGHAEPRDSFGGSLDRLLLTGIALAAVVFVLITITIGWRIFAPVEALTNGARSLAAGRFDARVAVTGDDEIAELARAFNGMAAALERNETTRRNMVGDIAHELRTPLTNVRCQLESVQDGLTVADRPMIDSMAEELERLAQLVDDLQQLSLAEAGVLRLDLRPVSAETLVRSAVGAHTVETSVEPLTVLADERRAVQILRNVVSNALAHASSHVALHVERRGSFAAFVVDDDGPGIAPEHLERIFERFHRADPSRSRITGGAGLGLAIARELTELHGGSIAAENRHEGGARFTVALPLFITSS